MQIRKNFVKSAKALHKTFLKNHEQEYHTPPGIERVFHLWEAIFRNELKQYISNDEKISEFIGKVMQHGKIVKKDGNPSELNYDCQGAINELNLSDDQRKEVSDIVKKYLNIRDDYLALQKTYWRDLQKECSTDLGGINDSVIANNKQVEENFFNSAKALHKKLLQNFKQEYSSTPVGISRVFYVCAAIFRNELKEYNLNDKQISKFLGKVMLKGKIVKKEGDTFELAIDELLKLSDDQRKKVSDMVKEYLKIRDGWKDWQTTYYWKNLSQEEGSENLCLIKENFFNSVEGFHETLLQNFKQEYPAPRGIGGDFDSANLDGVETPITTVGSANGQNVLGVVWKENRWIISL